MSRDVFIDVDLETEDLFITTDSILGSGQLIKIYVFDQTNEKNIAALWITFGENFTYHVGKCTKADVSDTFPVSPPTAVNRIWKISESVSSLGISCNGMQILNYEFANGHQDNCALQWALDAARIKFDATDTASKSYRISSKLTISK